MSKKLVLEFYDFSVRPKAPGLKHVMFRLVHPQGKFIGFDWGYAYFDGSSFEQLQTEEVIATVVKWCDMPDPKLLF